MVQLNGFKHATQRSSQVPVCVCAPPVPPSVPYHSVRYNDVPSRGVLATIASEDKSFECHITTGKVPLTSLIHKHSHAGFPLAASSGRS